MADHASRIRALESERDNLISGKEELSGNVSSVIEQFNNVGNKVNTISNDNLSDTEDTLLGSTMLNRNKLIIESVDKTVKAISAGAETANGQIGTRIEELKSSITMEQRAAEKEAKDAAGTPTDPTS